MDWLTAALAAFVVIVPVDLPDKPFVATLVLATKYRPWPVWLGVPAACGVQCVVAVAAGRLIALLPERPVKIAAALLFAVGAVILYRGARKADEQEAAAEQQYESRITDTRTGLRAFGASFLVLFAAEWGDLSQLLTASLVAAGRSPVPVFFGAWVALALVAGAAVVLGRVLLRRVRLPLVRSIVSAACAV